MTQQMRQFLLCIQNALHDLAQSADAAEYNKLQEFVSDRGLEGIGLDEIVDKNLL